MGAMGDFVDHMLSVLNRATVADRDAIAALIEARVPCNQALADDPTIQVGSCREPGTYTVGLLGILSGIAGAHPDGFSQIAAVFEVVCPKHGKADGVVGDACTDCGAALELGRLESFVRTRQDAHKSTGESDG
jgi:hypothetical protein